MKSTSDNLPCLAGQIQIIDLLNISQDTQEYLESTLMSRSLPFHVHSQCSAYIPNKFFALLESRTVELQFALQPVFPISSAQITLDVLESQACST